MNNFEDKRHTDPLLHELIREVRGFRADMKPIQEFMTNVKAAQKAAIWIVAMFAAIGAAITWALNVRHELGSHLR